MSSRRDGPSLLPTPPGLRPEYVQRELREYYHHDPRRYVREQREDFLDRVAMAQQLGHGRDGRVWGEDSGRTSGISGSGGYAPPEQHPYDSDQAGMVGDLRELQRKRGIAW